MATVQPRAFPFKKVVGVEISERLHEIAAANIACYEGPQVCRDVTSVCGDAGVCEFPNDPLVLLLFNPFETNVLRALLDNLHKSLLENPRPVLLLYGSPKHREVFEETPWLRSAGTELKGWYLKFEVDLTNVRSGT